MNDMHASTLIKRALLSLEHKPIKRDKNLFGYVDENAQSTAKEISFLIDNAEADKGGIILVTGPQSSGKSLVGMYLMEYCHDHRHTVVAAQPKVDRTDVPTGKLFSRSGFEVSALSFQTKKDIEKLFHNYDVVVLDEIQFTPATLQSFLLKEMKLFRDRGGWVVVLALLYTSLGTEFLISSVLKDEASVTFTLRSTCQMCGRRIAKYNQRLIGGKPASQTAPDLMPPSKDVEYEPRCEDCYVVVGE